MRRLLGGLAIVLLCLMSVPAARAEEDYNRVTLKGLRGVSVVIEKINSEAESDGLSLRREQ
jgi:hypothetical protein